MSSFATFYEFGPYLRSSGDVIVPKIYHYQPGTSTLKNAWIDRNKVNTAEQPIEGDAGGIASAFFDGLYKIEIRDENDIVLYVYDNWGEGGAGTVYTNGDTTPSVNGVGFLVITNSAPTTIVLLDDAAEEQELTLLFTDSNTTIQDGNLTIQLAGSVDFHSTANDTLTLIYHSGTWYEKARSVN